MCCEKHKNVVVCMRQNLGEKVVFHAGSKLVQGYYPKQIRKDKKLRSIAENLRLHETSAEAVLWKKLKGKKLGYKFRRQHPLHGFIVDFYCYELMLVIEVDGSIHDNQQDKDRLRDSALQQQGYRTLRIQNAEVMNDLSAVLQKIVHKPPLS